MMAACARSRAGKNIPRGGGAVRVSVIGPAMSLPGGLGGAAIGSGQVPVAAVSVGTDAGAAAAAALMLAAVIGRAELLRFDAPVLPRPVNVTAITTAMTI